MRGAIPQLSNTPSWRGAQLKAQEQIYLYIFLEIREGNKFHYFLSN
jgi:hypothetical protein